MTLPDNLADLAPGAEVVAQVPCPAPTLLSHVRSFKAVFCACVTDVEGVAQGESAGVSRVFGGGRRRIPVRPLRRNWPEVGGQASAVVPELRIEIGRHLLPLVYPPESGPLTPRVKGVRALLRNELGVVLPPVRVRDNLKLTPDTYRIMLGGDELGRWDVSLSQSFLVSPNKRGSMDPVYGLCGAWTECPVPWNGRQARFHAMPYLLNHVLELARSHADLLLGTAGTEALLATVKVKGSVSVPRLCAVLQSLLREQVSIRELATVVRCFVRCAAKFDTLEPLVEAMRRNLQGLVCQPWLKGGSLLPALKISRSAERELLKYRYVLLEETLLDTDRELPSLLLNRLRPALRERLYPLVVPHDLRPAVKRFLAEHGWPQVPVLASNEIPTGVRLEVVETLSV